jgi:hypothetical protein
MAVSADTISRPPPMGGAYELGQAGDMRTTPIGIHMKWIPCLVALAMTGCVAGSTVSHEDDPAAVKRDAGPDLCRDGTAPPCTPRD